MCFSLQGKLASNDLSAALPIVLLLGSITQQQPALLSDYLPQLKECMASFAGKSTGGAKRGGDPLPCMYAPL